MRSVDAKERERKIDEINESANNRWFDAITRCWSNIKENTNLCLSSCVWHRFGPLDALAVQPGRFVEQCQIKLVAFAAFSFLAPLLHRRELRVLLHRLLFHLLDLHLFAELLQLAIAFLLLALVDALLRFQQMRLHAQHVFVALHHLGKVVVRSDIRNAGCVELLLGARNRFQSTFIASKHIKQPM